VKRQPPLRPALQAGATPAAHIALSVVLVRVFRSLFKSSFDRICAGSGASQQGKKRTQSTPVAVRENRQTLEGLVADSLEIKWALNYLVSRSHVIVVGTCSVLKIYFLPSTHTRITL
jgi:hypothetical protein